MSQENNQANNQGSRNGADKPAVAPATVPVKPGNGAKVSPETKPAVHSPEVQHPIVSPPAR